MFNIKKSGINKVTNGHLLTLWFKFDAYRAKTVRVDSATRVVGKIVLSDIADD